MPSSTIMPQAFKRVESLKPKEVCLKVEHHDLVNVTSLEQLDGAMDKLCKAEKEFAEFTQAKVDMIVNAAADHFMKYATELGNQAHEETGMGNPVHKMCKNLFAVDYVRKWYSDTPTCGVVSHDAENGIDIVASPMGVVAAVIPTTNPTSTVAFKALCCLKTRNAIIVAPHPRAKKCTAEALRIIIEGAVSAGAPKDIAAIMSEPSIELTGNLMKHEKTSLLLATGGPGMVKAAYASGHPAIGVGPGNVPVVVDEFANLLECATNVVGSKNFDNGVICSSEQVIIAHEFVYEDLKAAFKDEGAHFLTPTEAEKVGELMFKAGGALNADVVGQSPVKIANMAGLEVPEKTTLLVGEFIDEKTSPFAKEKLSPVLGFCKRNNIDELFSTAVSVLKNGGQGHTAVYYTNKETQLGRVQRYANAVIVTRCLINQPSAPGGIGGIYNFGLPPSMTLGCGSYGGNYLSENVGPLNLLNYKKVARCANDHTIVMKNIDVLVPPHIATRCAMEIVILIITIVAKNRDIVTSFGELRICFDQCVKFVQGKGEIQRLREAILYFSRYGLFTLGHCELALQAACDEFNIPGGNLYPILFPRIAPNMEGVNWKNLEVLNAGIDSLDLAIGLIKKLQVQAGMLINITESTKARISKSCVSLMTGAIQQH